MTLGNAKKSGQKCEKVLKGELFSLRAVLDEKCQNDRRRSETRRRGVFELKICLVSRESRGKEVAKNRRAIG